MADREQRLAIIVTAQDLASGKLGKVKRELGGLGGAGKAAALGLGGAGLAANRMGGAITHLGGRVSNLLTGPLGIVGLGVGLAGVSGFLKTGIDHAEEFGRTSADLAKLIDLPVEATSRLVDALDKYGIAGDAQLATIGKQLKGAEALAGSKKKAAAFEKAYGFSLTDTTGRIADANEILKRSADFFNGSASASAKATVLSKLYGRSWQTLIPVLSLGAKGIQKEEDAALHLSAAQIKQLADLRVAQRDFNDTVGDTQTLVGLQMVPLLTDLAKGANEWLSAAGNQQAIHDGFEQGIHLAKELGGVIQHDVIPTVQGIAGAAKGMWDSIPAPLRDLLIRGFVANKAVKFLFGFDPAGLVIKAATGGIAEAVGKGLFSRGGTPATPLFVADVAGGLGGAGAIGATSKWVKVGNIIGLAIGAAAIVSVAEIADVIHTAITPYGGLQGRLNAGKPLPTDQLSWPWGPKNTPRIDLGPFKNILGGDSAFASSSTGTENNPGKQVDDVVKLAAAALVSAKSAAAGPGGPFTAKELEAILQRNWLPKANDAELQGILERGIAAGFKPKGGISGEAVANTYRRNIQRAAEAQKTAIDSAKNLLHSDLVEIRNLTGRNPITNVTVIGGGGTPKVNTSTGFTVPPPQRRTILPGDSFGEGHARGTFGLTRGWTPLGYAGEAGGEAVAIVKNPRPIAGGSGVGRAEIAAIVAAIQIGLASATIRTRATVSARENESTTTTRHRWSNPSTVTAH